MNRGLRRQNPPHLSAIFAALADPTRRAILERLSRGEATPGELARPLRISWPAVTKHLHVLERAGLLQRRRDGRKHVLTFQPEAMRPADAWIATYRRFGEGRLDALANCFQRSVTRTDPATNDHSRSRGDPLFNKDQPIQI